MQSKKAFWQFAIRCAGICLVGLLAGAIAGQAQLDPGISYEKVLVPFNFAGAFSFPDRPVPGAFGSLWMTEFWLRNNGNQAVDIRFYDDGCRINECPPTLPTPPSVSFRPGLSGSPLRGIFLFVDRQHVSEISFSLRVKDLSRLDQSLGAELPVVREAEFRSDRIVLPGIPIRTDFRHTLRIYELEGRRDTQVRVRVYGADSSLRFPHDPSVQPDPVLGESVVLVHAPGPQFSPIYPGYAEIGDLSSLAPLGGADTVTLEILPETPGVRFWAFLTVTQNETQRVTVVSPR